METTLLNELIIIFALSVAVFFVFHRFKIPAIVGFLLTGMLAGPHGLGLIKSVHEVEYLAEIGVVLLLFTLGIEFSFDNLWQIKKSVFVGGLLQVSLTIISTVILTYYAGQPFVQSVFLGFLISLSSTAIVLKLIQERAEIDSPNGRTTLGILIFQDIAVVPMMLAIPLLAGTSGGMQASFVNTVIKGTAVIFLVIFSAKWIVPNLLFQIAKTRNRELFLLSVIVICFSVAWLTSSVGLSLALGAFLAGLIISESDYSHEALGNVLPFKDIFTSIFFISIGMLLDVGVFLKNPWLIIGITLCVIILKIFTAGLATIFLGFPLRTAILVGFKLAQIGEFSFVLSKVGVGNGLLGGDDYQIFLAVSILTMVATPFLVAGAPHIADFVDRIPFPKRMKDGLVGHKYAKKKRHSNHIIIIGYGLNGKNLARASKFAKVPYIIIEMNPQIVKDERKNGEPIIHGDATHSAVLEYADIKEAKVAVVAISDALETRKIVKTIRRHNPNIYIIVRTRYIQEVSFLYELGTNEVIPEEFETSIEIFTRVLEKYIIPRSEINDFIDEVRSDGYKMFRNTPKESEVISDLRKVFHDVELNTLRVAEGSPFIGKTLGEIDLRRRYGITLLQMQRDSNTISNPHGDEKIKEGDIVIISGPPDKISEVTHMLSNLV